MYDEDMVRKYPYFGEEHVVETDGVRDDVADAKESLTPWGFEEGIRSLENPNPDYTFPFGLGDLVTACAASGLGVELLREYDTANGARLSMAVRK
jgi:hypothetical protein